MRSRRPFPVLFALNLDPVSGPGFRISDFESNRIIGQKQFEGAQVVMNGVRAGVKGKVRSVHVYLDM